MATPVDLARGWMQKGESDRLNADRTTQTAGPYDTACFHAQQAVEKYLKALLALAGSPIPRTHDLEDIYDALCGDRTGGLLLDPMELSPPDPVRRAIALRRGVLAGPATGPSKCAGDRRSRSAMQSKPDIPLLGTYQ